MPAGVIGDHARLAMQASGATLAVRRLMDGVESSIEDLASFGRLNSHCFLMGDEPMVMLIDRPRLDPAVAEVLGARQ